MVEYFKVYCKPRLGEASALAVYSGRDVYNVFRTGGQALGMTGKEIMESFTGVDGKDIKEELFKLREGGRLPLRDKYPYDLQGFYWLQQGIWVVHGTPMNTAEFKRLFIVVRDGSAVRLPDIQVVKDSFTLMLNYFDGDAMCFMNINKYPNTWVMQKEGRNVNLVDGDKVYGLVESYRSIVGEDHVSGVLLYKGKEYRI